jgi:murein DD-endopeptidase MepM/ murein hydrolase activator NlpD
MKKRFMFFFVGVVFFCRAQISETNNESSVVYDLPFEKNKKVFVSQGYGGFYSHKNQFSIDFKLKKGTKVLAARSGKVIKVVDHNSKGGPKKKYLSMGNHVIIKHDDNTYAAYWHLMENGSLVEKGDKITRGQCIALSGNTGYSTMPHLHFDVYKYNKEGKHTTIPTLFHTNKGIVYLKAYRKYKKPNL